MIRKFKFFFRPVLGLTRWLNEMSNEGYRLIKTGNIFYYFEECQQSKYIYAVDYVANKSYSELKDYEDFLDETNIRYIEKPTSIGKISKNNIRWRPYADKGGRIATSKGMIKRELLILEKENDGKVFEVNTTIIDKINSLKIMRKPTVALMIFIGIMMLISNVDFITQYQWSIFEFDLFSVINNFITITVLVTIELLLFLNLIRFNIKISRLRKEGEID